MTKRLPNEPQKHHYLPEFILKRWADTTRKLVQFCRPYQSKVIVKRVYPAETGFTRNLYTVAVSGTQSDSGVVEKALFQPIDSGAAMALKKMEADGIGASLSASDRASWSRFLTSLLVRMPEDIAFIRKQIELTFDLTAEMHDEAEWQAVRRPDDPATIAEFLRESLLPDRDHGTFSMLGRFLAGRSEPDSVIKYTSSMSWRIFDVKDARHPLLFSDRPILTTNGIKYHNSQIVLPVAPRKIFIACNSTDEMSRIAKIAPDDLVAQANEFVCGQARQFVYADSEKPLRFVSKHMGTRPERRLVERSAPEAMDVWKERNLPSS
jgi:Protein of unknown function (DUF4238)